VLPTNAFRLPVDAMKGREARAPLSCALPQDQVLSQFKELNNLAGRLGEWAQLLKLVNGFFRERVIEGCEPLRNAIIDADARLTHEGLSAFDADDEGDRSKAVASTINLSLGLAQRKTARRICGTCDLP